MIDIIEVKTLVNNGDLEVSVFNESILLKDKHSGEAVKIGTISNASFFDYSPTIEQWKRIKSVANMDNDLKPSDVFVLRVKLCNDKIDADYEKFDSVCLPEIANMFIGTRGIIKNKKLSPCCDAVIFDAWAVIDKNGVTSVMADVFAYRNSNTEALLELIKCGDLPKVHIGIAMERAYCSICGNEYGSFYCDHRKGQTYDGDVCYITLSEPDHVCEFNIEFEKIKTE